MTWLKVDDQFPDHPKVKAIPRKDRHAALGAWQEAACWATRHLTDGFLPKYMGEELGIPGRIANHLVRVGLWDEYEAGWQFHDWLEYQPSRASVEQRRADEADRKARWRASKQQQREGNQA